MRKRFLSVFLAIIFTLTLTPPQVSALGGDDLTGTGIEIHVGETVEISFEQWQADPCITFTPARDGVYTLYSEGDLDTRCTLYDSKETQLGTNDDSGTDRNFRLTAFLKGGETYTYQLDLWSSSEGSHASVTLDEHPMGVLSPDKPFSCALENGAEIYGLKVTVDQTEGYAFDLTGFESGSYALYDSNSNRINLSSEYDSDLGTYVDKADLTAGEAYYLIADVEGSRLDVRMTVAHSYQSTVEVAKTCSEDGLLHYTCRYCTENYTEILPGGHEYTDGICTLCGELFRAEGTCGTGLRWQVEGTTLTISGTGAMDDYEPFYDPAPWNSCVVKTVVVESGVTSIGDYAFIDLKNVESISIGESVVTLGRQAFGGLLTELTVPASVTNVADYAFSGLYRLSEITFLGDAPTIAENAFYMMDDLTAYYPHDNSTWNDSTLQNYGAAELVWSLKHTYGDWQETKAPSADSYGEETRTCTLCSHEESREIPSGSCGGSVIWSLRDNVLTVSGSGPMLEQPVGLTYIFTGSITDVIVESGVTALCGSAFSSFGSLARVSLPETLTAIGSHAFSYCEKLTEIVIPPSVTEIESSAFRNCSALTRIVIPEGITGIENSTFTECTSLTEVILPYTLQEIGYEAFSKTGLTSVVLPPRVKQIDSYAFSGCTALQSVYALGDRPVYAVTSGFEGCENAVCYADSARRGWDGSEWLGLPLQKVTVQTSGSASCTAGGTWVITCPEHSFTQSRETGPLGHWYADAVLHRAATPTEAGTWLRECTVCGHQKYVRIPVTAAAAQTPAAVFDRSDSHRYSYYWATCVYDYLIENDDGTYTRVFGDWWESNTVCVETYDENFRYLSTRGVVMELPIFGGYYTDGNYHYLVFGQENDEENDGAEVVRLVVYDRNWNRIACASAFGSANVTLPFRAGTLRMASDGEFLYIHTSRRMYAASDGTRHQANMTLWIPLSELLTPGEVHWLNVTSAAYASHSFNQFIKPDGGKLYLLDHGDAYPRSAVISVLSVGSNSYSFIIRDAQADIMTFPGEIGDNYTGATLGGFEISDSSILAAGTSIDQSLHGDDRQYNVFLTVTPKDDLRTDNTQTLWLTSYESTDDRQQVTDVSNPHLVKIREDSYCILWTESSGSSSEQTLCYTFLNGNGELQSEIYRTSGRLSDCVPIVSKGKLVWLVCNDKAAPTFYSIDLSNPSGGTIGHIHSYTAVVTAPTCTEQGYTTYTCQCGDSYVGDYVEATGHNWGEGVITTQPTEETEGVRTFTCAGCGDTKTESIAKLDHTHSYTAAVTAPTCTEQGYTTYTCQCGDSYTSDYVEATGHSWGAWETVKEATEIQAGEQRRECLTCRLSERLEIPVLERDPDPAITFTDVPEGAWFSDAVNWAVTNNITSGTGNGTFSPDMACSRSQVVTFLYRAAGSPEVSGENPFTDVSEDAWYYKAVLWAVENGITSGTTATTFAPDMPCSRSQVVTFLYRAAGAPEVSVSNPFSDVDEGAWYYNAVLWAVENSITSGTTATTFAPDMTCSRSQVVTFLYRAED